MRIAIAILLFFSLAFQCFVKLGVVVWFNYNKTYIAKNICENRDKPQMKCCGKCYLKKQLNKAGDETSKHSGSLPLKWEKNVIPVFLVPERFVMNDFHDDSSLKHNTHYSYSIFPVAHPSVFHPPHFAV